MPIPTPKKNEDQDKFMDRCMSNDTMNEEYPDSKQRYAICIKQWEDKDKESKDMSKDKLEQRSFTLSELRQEDMGEGRRVLTGYASVFNQETRIGWFKEKVKRGAFSETIQRDDIRALFNHNANYILGRNKSGTLRMLEDENGLKIEIDAPDTSYARDLLVSVDRGDISQMSFSFEAQEEEWQKGEEGQPDVRTLVKVRLWDVSPVTYPAYENTSVDVATRSHEKWQKEQEESKSAEKENSIERDAEGKPTVTLKIKKLKLGLKSKM